MSRTSPLATGSVAPQWEPSSAMLALLDRLRSGAELVTGERTTRRGRRAMQAEVGGERASTGTVRGLIRLGLVRVKSKTRSTTTWETAA